MNEVARTMGISWDALFGKPAVEFLNVCAYLKDKGEHDALELEKWKKTH